MFAGLLCFLWNLVLTVRDRETAGTTAAAGRQRPGSAGGMAPA
jgi:hypothetical protein